MDWYKEYRLVEDGDGYTVEIQLNKDLDEFSEELVSNIKENLLKVDDQINKFIDETFSDIKVNSIKLMVGTLVVASIPFMAPARVQAAEITSTGISSPVTQSTSIETINTYGVVTATRLNVRSGPATTNSIIHVLWQGNKLKVTGQSGDWYKIQLSDGRIGWVSKAFLSIDMRQEQINKVIDTAKSLIGTPYVWGGNSIQAGGFDCSGLTQYTFSEVGVTLNRISTDQAKQGSTVTIKDLQPGDLIFFSFAGNGIISHVGIYIGNNQMIHSPKTGDTVKITDISTSYWQSRFVTAKRII